MHDVISTCAKFNNERLAMLKEYKGKNDRKIVGYFCSQTPEELIYASGMLPIRIIGNKDQYKVVDGYLQTYVCSFARNCLDLLLLGEYDFLDGVVVPHTCDTIRGLYGIIDRNVKVGFTHFIKYPITIEKPSAAPAIMAEYMELIQKLEKYTGKEITMENIKDAIAVYNKNRELLRKLAQYRLASDRRISGKDYEEVVLAGFCMDKKEHNILLEKLLADLAKQEPVKSSKPRLLVIGNVINNSGLIGIIEGAGADVVWDDLCTGTRYIGPLVDEKKAPLDAIFEQYLARTYCPCKGQLQRRIDYLLNQVKEYNAQGVIALHQKFCDPHLWDIKYVREEMEKAGIPVVEIEFEQYAGDKSAAGAMQTRIQSLIEMIGGR